MCDLICDVITSCVLSCDMGKINVYKKNRDSKIKKRENMEINEILHKTPSKRSFMNGIHSLLKRADAKENADIIYIICDAHR